MRSFIVFFLRSHTLTVLCDIVLLVQSYIFSLVFKNEPFLTYVKKYYFCCFNLYGVALLYTKFKQIQYFLIQNMSMNHHIENLKKFKLFLSRKI